MANLIPRIDLREALSTSIVSDVREDPADLDIMVGGVGELGPDMLRRDWLLIIAAVTATSPFGRRNSPSSPPMIFSC